MNRRFDVQNIRQALGKQPTMDELRDEAIGAEKPQIVEKTIEVVPEGAIVRREDGALVYKRFVMTQTGMEIPADMTREEWADVGHVMKSLDSSVAWNVGDWAIIALDGGMTAAEIADEFGYDTSTIEVYVSVCRAVRGLIRNQASSFGHARLVAHLDEGKQDYWLRLAMQSGWTIKKLRETMHPKKENPTVPAAKQAMKYTSQVNKAAQNLSVLDSKRRQQVAERAEWLADYYAGIARQARRES